MFVFLFLLWGHLEDEDAGEGSEPQETSGHSHPSGRLLRRGGGHRRTTVVSVPPPWADLNVKPVRFDPSTKQDLL